MLGKTARFLYFNFFVRPIVFLYLGVNIRRRNLIPKQGPAILVANHMCLGKFRGLRARPQSPTGGL